LPAGSLTPLIVLARGQCVLLASSWLHPHWHSFILLQGTEWLCRALSMGLALDPACQIMSLTHQTPLHTDIVETIDIRNRQCCPPVHCTRVCSDPQPAVPRPHVEKVTDRPKRSWKAISSCPPSQCRETHRPELAHGARARKKRTMTRTATRAKGGPRGPRRESSRREREIKSVAEEKCVDWLMQDIRRPPKTPLIFGSGTFGCPHLLSADKKGSVSESDYVLSGDSRLYQPLSERLSKLPCRNVALADP
jgi:hypothetical protein